MTLGYAAALAAAFSYAGGTLVVRKIVTEYASPLVRAAFSLMFGTLVVAALFHRHLAEDLPRAPRSAWVFVALSSLTAVWGVVFFFLAIDEAAVVVVAPVIGASPLVSILLAYILLRRLESVSWRTVIGAVLVVAGVALIALGRG